MIRALIFDFDGLILDTETPEYYSWKHVYEKYGQKLPISKWLDFMGKSYDTFKPLEDLASILGGGSSLDRDEILDYQRDLYYRHFKSSLIMPGVERTIREARQLNLKVGLASSSTLDWVEKHLRKLGLWNAFDAIKTRENVSSGKPDPEVYTVAMQSLDCDSNEAIAIEDSLNGIKAAKGAGLFCVAVPLPITRHLSFDRADILLDSLNDLNLEKVISEFNKRRG